MALLILLLNNVLAGGRFDNIATVSIDTEVTAIFGSVKFPLADDLSLLLAGRYTDHSKYTLIREKLMESV